MATAVSFYSALFIHAQPLTLDILTFSPYLAPRIVLYCAILQNRKAALQTFVTEYLSVATWIHLYVDEPDLNHKVDRWVNANELDELTMAYFFALSATTLHYIQWDHKIRRNWPEDSTVSISSNGGR